MSLQSRSMRVAGLIAIGMVLAGCEDGFQMPFGQNGSNTSESAPSDTSQTRLVERDVEAPEVFQTTEDGLWDGRPSLGGVWVAHPDATDPERVIIRNEANGRFVIGALFRRERENPGPLLQVSSDAAAALNMVAGAPTELNVTALRREEVEEPDPEAVPPAGTIETSNIAASELDDPLAAAAAAIDEAEAAEAAPSAPAAVPQVSSLDRPFIQIGIFSVEANADRTGQMMRNAGLVPTIHEQTSNGRPFWRVVVGPARNRTERQSLLESVRGLGFEDAYFVTN